MKKVLRVNAARFVFAALAVLVITYCYFKIIHVNPATVGFTFLLSILAISAAWGLACAVFTAVLATLAYNFFFLPPVRTFTIVDPQNWIALGTFLITAIIASHLSNKARQEALNANHRRQEVERLYAFSQQLLAIDNVPELFNAIPGQVVQVFEAISAGIFLNAGAKVYYSDLAAQTVIGIHDLHATAARGEPSSDEAATKRFAPLRIGVRSVGAIGVVGGSLSRETLEAVGSLVAIAVERAGAMEQLGRAEAARESEKLRTVLLDSVTHEFRTPLTSILAAAKAMLADDELQDAARKELLAVINEEGERLNRLVGEAAEMAQLDAHQVELQLRPGDLHEAVDGALEETSRILKEHTTDVSIPDDLPRIRMDIKRIQEVITHLLDNAAKYSPAGTPIHITVELRGDSVITSVADRGPGIDDFEQALIFDKFYRGRGQRSVHGTGMGLAIAKAIVEAHGGRIGLTSQLGHGSVFYFSLPAVD